LSEGTATTEGLRLNLFGTPEVIFDGAAVRGYESAKVQALLYFLAVTGRAHSREVLATLLWGDLPESTAKRNLTKALTNLRQLIGPYLLIERHSVAFNRVAPYSLDVAIFQVAVEGSAGLKPDNRERDLTPLRQAIGLYRGDFLEGFYVKNALEFEEWALNQRERLRALMLQALRSLTEYYAQANADPALAREYAARWLALEPWQEAAHRQMMLLLVRGGQPGAALAQYETCRRILAEELGVEPMAETTALYERLKAAGAPPSHNLPSPPNAFVGREVELAQIADNLAAPECRLLTLVGPGGIGKTRLALEAARRYLQPDRLLLDPGIADGVYLVSLASITLDQGPSAATQITISLSSALISAIADAVNISLHGATDLRKQLLSYLRQKALLLVVDNVEHLLAPLLPAVPDTQVHSSLSSGSDSGVELLADILRHAPQVKLLVTSRERLNLQEEWALVVEGLTYPSEGAKLQESGVDAALPSLMPKLKTHSAIALFARRAQQALPGFSLSEADLPHVVRICQLVEGMPLGLELAASWLRSLSCEEIAAEIERGLGFLETPLRNLPARHRSLRAVFEHSWAMLTPDDRRVFAQLSIFRGGFRREAAASVAGAALPTLARLGDKSLLRRTADGRYEAHELLRQYTAEKLWTLARAGVEPTDGQREGPLPVLALWQRYSTYFLKFIYQQEGPLRGSAPQQAIAALRADLDNIRQAWLWAMTEGSATLLEQAAGGLARFFDLTGLSAEGESMFEQATAYLRKHVAIAGDDADQMAQVAIVKLQVEQARLLIRRGLPEQAVRIMPQAAELAHTIQDTRLEATTFLQWSETLFFYGDTRASQLRGEQALGLARSAGLLDIQAEALRYVGIAVKEQGEYTKASDLYEQALACFRQLGDRRGESLVLNNLGILARAWGRFAEAQSRYEQALQGFHEIGDLWGQGVVLTNLGYMLYDQGLYSQAETIYHQGLQISREIKNQYGASIFLENLGNLLRDTGDFVASQSYYDQALQIRREIGAQLQVGETLAELALLFHLTTDNEVAREYSQQAAEIGRLTGSAVLQATALLYLGHAETALGCQHQSVEAYQQAIALRQKLGEHPRATEAQAGLAQAYLVQGDLSQALTQAEIVMAYLDRHPLAGIVEPFRVYLTCYRILQANQDRRAWMVLETAQRLLQERAASIANEELRRMFLANIPAHREIIREFQRL
jgi:DNA-binding SARP family transcriptional activator/predicted ATPase/Tfp pilus assembly protein PilF